MNASPAPELALQFRKVFSGRPLLLCNKNRSGRSGAVLIKEIDVTCLNLSRQLF